MRVTILGSGTAVPSFARFPAGYLVEAGGRLLVVDLGPGVLRRLAQVGVGPEALDAVLLTHFHTDHCADVAALLFALRNPRYAGKKLTVYAHAGLREWLARLQAAWPWLEPRGYDLELVEIGPGEHSLCGVPVLATRIAHTAQSLAYRIGGRGGPTCAFSGDADVCDGLVEAARGADLFVCEAAYPDALRQPGHLTPSLAAEHAARAGCGTLCLTHFYPECEGHDLLGQAQARFAGKVVLAEDRMRFEVGR